MRSIQLLTILVSSSVGMSAHANALALRESVESGIAQAIDRGFVRAAAVGLYDSGETKVFGFGQLASDDDRTPDGDTVFEIGSITKVFTALLSQVQVETEKLSWDDTIGQRLLNVEFASKEVAAIALRELATHTSGLPRMPSNMAITDPLNPYKGYDRDSLIEFIASYQADKLVKQYAYSNLAFGLLGEIAADAAGTEGNAYAAAMMRDVLKPLELSDTTVVINDEMHQRLAHGFSQGRDMPNWDGFDALAGAGALLSTTDDMLKFIDVNLHASGNTKDNRAKLHAALAAIRKPVGTGTTGLGWHITTLAENDSIWWHNGGTGGYASLLALRPRTQTGVVLLTTSTDYDTVTQLGLAQIMDDVPEPAVDLNQYAGAYKISDRLTLSVFVDGDELFIQGTGQPAAAVRPEGEHEFTIPMADIRIVFDAPVDGTCPSLTLHQTGLVMPAPRRVDADAPDMRTIIAVEQDTLNEYIGQYQLAPQVVVTIEARDQQLFAQLTAQTSIPVFAYAPDRFLYKVVDAQLHFERDDDGNVVALVLNQSGKKRAPKIE